MTSDWLRSGAQKGGWLGDGEGALLQAASKKDQSPLCVPRKPLEMETATDDFANYPSFDCERSMEAGLDCLVFRLRD
jgi:hypothetical protein